MIMVTAAREILLSKKRSSDIKLAGALLAFAGIEFWLVNSVSEAYYPNYSVHSNAISDLAAIGTRTTVIEGTAGLLWGLCWLLGAYFLFRNTGKKNLMVLNLLPGVGVLLAILSPENVNVIVHSIGAVIAFVPGALAAILSYKIIDSQFKYFSVALGTISLIAVVTEFGAYYSPIVQQTIGPGGWERMIVYPLLIWQIVLGGYLLGVASDRGGNP